MQDLDVCGREEIDESGLEFCGIGDLGSSVTGCLGGGIRQLSDDGSEDLADDGIEDFDSFVTVGVGDCTADVGPTRCVTVALV